METINLHFDVQKEIDKLNSAVNQFNMSVSRLYVEGVEVHIDIEENTSTPMYRRISVKCSKTQWLS